MFECVDCGFRGSVFNGEVVGSDQGAFTFRAKCPRCGSMKVNILPGPHERDLRIGLEVNSDDSAGDGGRWRRRGQASPKVIKAG